MTAKRMRLLTAGLAIIALIAALFVIKSRARKIGCRSVGRNSRREL